MIRPFGLRDMHAVRKLQADGAWLDLHHYLSQRRTALQNALISPVPWWGTGLASFVLENSQGVQGFVQMLKQPGGQAADLLFLAPSSTRRGDAAPILETLLAHCAASASEHGVRRLFASLPLNSADIEIFAVLGFAIYTNETILRLDAAPELAPAGMRRQQPDDAWWLRRLYSLYTPAPVQQAEGWNDKDEPVKAPVWWETGHCTSYVLERHAEIVGAVDVVSGRRGHWLILHGDASDSATMSLLVQQGLHALAKSRWPVYCAVRDYEGGLSAVLQDQGFTPFMQCARLVKHLVARVKTPELAPVPTLAVRTPS